MRRGHETKVALTPREKLKVAYAYEIMGIAQHDLAALFEVNQGRVAEAIKAVMSAVIDEEDEGEEINPHK